MEMTISIIALVISIFALIPKFASNRYARSSYKDQVRDRFVQMLDDMDKVFVEHPEMHKYFYFDETNKTYAELLPGNKDYELGLCIAEMFRDAFQYILPLKEHLSEYDRESYEDYKKMIESSPIYRTSLNHFNWHMNSR